MSHLDQYTYKLVDRKPVQCANDDAYWLWYLVEANRRVAKTTIGTVWISTVFTGLNIIPQEMALFETEVFGGKYDRETWRCRTWEEAEKQHERIVKMVEDCNEGHAADLSTP